MNQEKDDSESLRWIMAIIDNVSLYPFPLFLLLIIILYYILFYFILFYFILFYFILFYFILFYFLFLISLNHENIWTVPRQGSD